MEPWGNDYEPPIQISEQLSLSESDVNPPVETENWESFESPQVRSLPNRLMVILFYPPEHLQKLSRQIEDLEIGIKYFF
ncbi:hypothetical protein ACWATR_11845 [Nostoc sp. UIC 10890]